MGKAADRDHGGGRWRIGKIFPPQAVDDVEPTHVFHVDIDPADVFHGAAGRLDSGLDVFAHLPCLNLDVAGASDRAVGAFRCHAGDEHNSSACLDRVDLREVTARLADAVRNDLAAWHARYSAGAAGV